MRWLLCAALAAVVPAHAIDADVVIPRSEGTVNFDGRIDEPMWRMAARLTHTSFTRWDADAYDTALMPFHLRFFHDGRMLYVALVSYDRDVEADATPENSDGLYSLSLATRAGKLRHYRLRWSENPTVADGEMRVPRRWGARLRGPFGAPSRAGGGYVFEFAIPLSDLGWKPGDTVPANIIVNDRNGKPGATYRTPGAEFRRYAWGSFDNENRAAYRTIKLAP